MELSRLKYVLILLIGIANILLGCGPFVKISNDYSKSALECGIALEEPYLRITNESGEFYNGQEFESFIWNDATKEAIQIYPTPKGCIVASQVSNSSLLLIRNDQNLSRVISTLGGYSEANISLTASPGIRPEQQCGAQYIASYDLDPRLYLSTSGLDITWLPFFSVSGYLVLEADGMTEVVRSFDRQSLVHWQKWSLGGVKKGSYLLQLEIHDYVHGGKPRVITCPIETSEIQLSVRVADEIKAYKEYFGQHYGVVESGYSVNFYIEGKMKNANIEYCVRSVDPKKSDGSGHCNTDEITNWLEDSPLRILDPGFYQIIYRSHKDEISTDWQVAGIMVDKACTGNFLSSAQVNEEMCTKLFGAIEIRGKGIQKLYFPYLSEVYGVLDIRQTDVETVEMPHLSVASSITIQENSKLFDLNFPMLTQISTVLEISQNNSLVEISGFQLLAFVGGSVQISRNRNLESITGFAQLRTLGGLLLHSNEEIESINGFHMLKRLDGDLTITSNYALLDINFLAQVQTISGNVSIDNQLLQNFSGLSSLIQVGGAFSVSGRSVILGLQGLGKLQNVGRKLTISNVNGLSNLSDLVSLKSVGGGVSIVGNNELLEIDFPSLQAIYEGLEIQSNPKLVTIGNLGSQSSLAGSLKISNNRMLDSIENLCPILGARLENVSIVRNPTLRSLSCLSRLEEIEGDLLIEMNSSLVNLDGFQNLRSVREILIVNNPLLTSLEGFGGLEVLASLTIRWNYMLRTLDGIEIPEKMDGSIAVQENSNLESISALSRLTSLSGYLGLYINPRLDALDGLEQLTEVSQLDIMGNDSLTNLDGLRSLKVIHSHFHLLENSNIISIEGLNKLARVGGAFIMHDNSSLTTLNGLNKLQYIGLDMELVSHRSLTDISALNSLRHIGRSLKITENNSIKSIYVLSNLEWIGRVVNIWGDSIDASTCPYSEGVADRLAEYCRQWLRIEEVLEEVEFH